MTKGPRLPNESLRSTPRPLIASAAFCCQRWNEVRVSSSRALKISSIWVASSVRLIPSVPPSGIVSTDSASASETLAAAPSETGAASVPGSVPDVSSTKVSPSSVFCRRIARASSEIGANSGSISITASVVSFPLTRWSGGARSICFTLPTETPPIRTSDSSASCVASGK